MSTSVAPASCALIKGDLLRSTRTSSDAGELVQLAAITNRASTRTNHRDFTGEDARCSVPNEGTRRDRRFGSTRFSVNRYGDSAGRQLRDHHGRGQFSYNRNDGAPHFDHLLEWLDPQCEHVPNAALGLDDARFPPIALPLAPQPQLPYVHCAIANIL